MWVVVLSSDGQDSKPNPSDELRSSRTDAYLCSQNTTKPACSDVIFIAGKNLK